MQGVSTNIFPKTWPCVCREGLSETELMRIHCTILVIEFVVDRVAVGGICSEYWCFVLSFVILPMLHIQSTAIQAV